MARSAPSSAVEEHTSTGKHVSAERRLLAIAEDLTGGRIIDLAGLWRALTSSEMTILDHFSTEERHYLLLSRDVDSSSPRINPMHLHLLERVLLGESQKFVAIEHRMAPSTVACGSTEALKCMGVRVSASRVPLLLALLVHAHYGRTSMRQGREAHFVDAGHSVRIVSTTRLDLTTWRALSPAEQQVLRLRAEGKSHAEIAFQRSSSIRTVANQVASATRKLGVSGRSELISYLSRGTPSAARLERTAPVSLKRPAPEHPSLTN